MYVYADSSSIAELLPMFFGILIGLAILLGIVYIILKKKDNNKPLTTKKVKILEKPVSQGNVAWYVVECEDGERLKLRSFKNNSVIITVGDEGILGYRGITIQSFKRLK